MGDVSYGAGVVVGAGLAALVKKEGEVVEYIEFDAENLGLDGGAETDGGIEVDEPRQQRAALLILGHGEVELEQVQHVGAHFQLQSVNRAG
jgi:hypothetical protein